MATAALFITHRTLPGKRDEVFRVWKKHLPPNVEANRAHEAYFYCFDDNDPDLIRVFQQYADAAASQVIFTAAWYADYLAEVEPLLAGPPEVSAATPVWSKA